MKKRCIAKGCDNTRKARVFFCPKHLKMIKAGKRVDREISPAIGNSNIPH